MLELAAAGQTDNTVAIVAVLVTGAVGVVGPLILSARADRRQRLEIAADREREARQARREVLDVGAALIQRWNMRHCRRGDAGVVSQPEGVDELHEELEEHHARLLLWFDDDDMVVRAFNAATINVVGLWATNLREADSAEDSVTKALEMERFEKAVDRERGRYLAAARTYLSGDA